jgi:hypothetical protein
MRRFHLFAACATAVTLLATLVACSSGHDNPDERGWFRSFTRHAAADLGNDFGLKPVAAAYLATCTDHRAGVSWQATLSARLLRGYPSRAKAAYEVSKTVLGRLRADAGLSGDQVGFVSASDASPLATDTTVLQPSAGSRVQVSVPLATSVLAAGYVSC